MRSLDGEKTGVARDVARMCLCILGVVWTVYVWKGKEIVKRQTLRAEQQVVARNYPYGQKIF